MVYLVIERVLASVKLLQDITIESLRVDSLLFHSQILRRFFEFRLKLFLGTEVSEIVYHWKQCLADVLEAFR